MHIFTPLAHHNYIAVMVGYLFENSVLTDFHAHVCYIRRSHIASFNLYPFRRGRMLVRRPSVYHSPHGIKVGFVARWQYIALDITTLCVGKIIFIKESPMLMAQVALGLTSDGIKYQCAAHRRVSVSIKRLCTNPVSGRFDVVECA